MGQSHISAAVTVSSRPPTVDGPARVLVVVEEPHRREPLRALLVKQGYDARTFSDLGDVLRAVHEYQPQMILLDARAGGGRGLELAGEIRATELARATPIVLVASGTVDEELVAKGLFAGADDFVSLTRTTELVARVHVHLRNKRGRDLLDRLRRERDAFRRDASLDALTQIPNRRAIGFALERATLEGVPYAVFFMDVDDFKSINDTLGHEVGDQVLRAIATAVRSEARNGDSYGRYGGEEFVVVARGATADVAPQVAERHRKRIEGLRIPALGDRGVTVSIGVAVFEPGVSEADAASVERRADQALYEAKRSGKNRVCVAPTAEAPDLPAPESERRPVPPPSPARPAPRAAPDPLEAALVRQLGRGRVWLPVLPEAASEALQLAGNPDADLKRIARLVDREPTLAARFLAVANSAMYARVGKVTSTMGALVRFGIGGARDLLFQVVYESSCTGLARYRNEVSASYQRSVLCAVASRTIAKTLKEPDEYAYLAGLLHDIGEARVFRILSEVREKSTPERVREIVDAHHEAAGAELAREWRLPAELVAACGSHHGDVTDATPVLIRHLMAADLISHAVLQRRMPDAEERDRIAALGVHEDHLRGVVEATRLAAPPPRR